MNNVKVFLYIVAVTFGAGASRAQEVQKRPVALTWNYDAQKKKLTLHLTNNSGKDITAYNISIAEKYADGSTNYAGGRPNDIHDHQRMEDLVNAMIYVQEVKGTPEEERVRREHGNGTFAAGTSRDQVIPEAKDITDVEAIVDMVIYADRTTDVQNERAFRQLLTIRKGQLLAMEKVNEVIKRALADPMVSSPVSAVLTELTQLADSLDAFKNRPIDDPDVAMSLRGHIRSLQIMQARKDIAEREQLTQYVEHEEKRMALISPHCLLAVVYQ